MLKLGECTKRIFCKDCTNARCQFSGQRYADCPYWICIDDVGDCNECRMLDKYYETKTQASGKANEMGVVSLFSLMNCERRKYEIN